MTKFKDFSNNQTIPIVMRDLNRLEELKGISVGLGETLKKLKENNAKDEDITDKRIACVELEDYIETLQTIEEDFTKHITSNLKLYGVTEGIPLITKSILDKIVVLAPPTTEYNCHGWSFGCVQNVVLYPKYTTNKGDLLRDVLKGLEVYQKLNPSYKNTIDKSFVTFFSAEKAALKEIESNDFIEGNIVIYYGKSSVDEKDKKLTHTARYTKSIDWYCYNEKHYGEWYPKDRGIISFDESSKNCTINGYISKLGAGYLVVHDFKDLIPLYGEDLEFYNVVVMGETKENKVSFLDECD